MFITEVVIPNLTQEELTLRLCTRGGDSQEPRKREALWEDWA